MCERDRRRERENERFGDIETDRVELPQTFARITEGLSTNSHSTMVHSTSQYCHLGDQAFIYGPGVASHPTHRRGDVISMTLKTQLWKEGLYAMPLLCFHSNACVVDTRASCVGYHQ